jgi:hypothetical protein
VDESHHHPETDIIVTVCWMIVVAVDRAGVIFIVVPRTAPQHVSEPPDRI